MVKNINHHGCIHSPHLHQRTQSTDETGHLRNRKIRTEKHNILHYSKIAHSQKETTDVPRMHERSVKVDTNRCKNKGQKESALLINKNNLSKDVLMTKIALNSSLSALNRYSHDVKNITGNDLKNLERLTESNGLLRSFITAAKGIVQFSDNSEITKSAQELLNIQIGGCPFNQFGTYSPEKEGSAANWIKRASDKELNSAAEIINQIAESAEKLVLRINAEPVSSPYLRHTTGERDPKFTEKRLAGDWTDKIHKQDRQAIYQKDI
ncbi:TPA: hypothetical protein ACIVDT_004889 [Salmonella enterica subsp. enterica serovar Eastbourne]|nr:hypothetical protein [Salmonella enterica subsp. enterica serovar Poona]